MSGWRAPLRLAGLVALTLAILVPLVPACLAGLLLAGAPAGERWRSGGLAARLDAAHLRALLALQRLWCRSLVLLLGVRVRVVGSRPAGAELLVCNHLSYLDIAVIGSATDCRFVAKSEVAGWPVMGVLARMARVLFVVRERRRDLLRVGGEMSATLAARLSIALFPEGTSSRGERVLPFHPGLLQPAAEAGVACRALALHYETPDDCRPPACTICWWDDMAFTTHVWNLMKIARIDATLTFAPQAVRDSDRKRLTATLHDQVAAAFRPVRQAAADTGGALAARSVVLP
jgi:1-acyl-sn-glycerol-3-phosphate acyltransferase